MLARFCRAVLNVFMLCEVPLLQSEGPRCRCDPHPAPSLAAEVESQRRFSVVRDPRDPHNHPLVCTEEGLGCFVNSSAGVSAALTTVLFRHFHNMGTSLRRQPWETDLTLSLSSSHCFLPQTDQVFVPSPRSCPGGSTVAISPELRTAHLPACSLPPPAHISPCGARAGPEHRQRRASGCRGQCGPHRICHLQEPLGTRGPG